MRCCLYFQQQLAAFVNITASGCEHVAPHAHTHDMVREDLGIYLAESAQFHIAAAFDAYVADTDDGSGCFSVFSTRGE